MMDTLHRLPKGECPYCAAVIDRAGGPETERPEPGDFSMCVRCGGYLVFGDKLQPIGMPDEMLETVEPETRAHLQRMRKLLRSIKEKTLQ